MFIAFEKRYVLRALYVRRKGGWRDLGKFVRLGDFLLTAYEYITTQKCQISRKRKIIITALQRKQKLPD